MQAGEAFGCPCPHPCPCAAVIEEANWLTLEKDLEKPGDGFDAVICLGNSFAHLPDFKGELGQGRGGGAPLHVCMVSSSRLRTVLTHGISGMGLHTVELLFHGLSPGRVELRPHCPGL